MRAVDVVVVVNEGAHRVLDILDYRCDVEARRWQARQAAEDVEAAALAEGDDAEDEDDEHQDVEPVESEGQDVEHVEVEPVAA